MARRTQDLRTNDRTIDVTDERLAADRRADDGRIRDGREPAGDRVVREERVGGHREPVHVEGNGTAVAALVTGLLSATFAFLIAPALAAILFGIVAIVLGLKGVGVANRLAGLHKGLAVSGIVSGFLGLVLGVAVVAGGVTLWQQGEVDVPPAVQDAVEQTDVDVNG